MFTYLPFLAEIGPQGGGFLDYGPMPAGAALAGLFFLILLCGGIVLDFALTVYFIKRPPRLAEWNEWLAARALGGKQILILVASLVAAYIICTLAYTFFFPYVSAPEPSTLVFQGILFNLPASLVIIGILIRRRVKSGEPAGSGWRRAPAMIGLGALFYVAAIPVIWFYSLLYQFFLYQLGVDFFMQDVAELFLMPAPVLERIAMYLTAIVLAPLLEELLFRGVLLPWTVRRFGYWPGIAAVSVLFAAIHVHLPSFLPLCLLSVFFCIAYSRTRSLWVPIVMHACFNAVSTVLLALTGG